ncbi:1-propanol dehydrogenase PduQ [Facklamia lactis]|uniref:1-propanol dehydrogenase PduQ n=1 Tax=Facklamia lactis TaxID=2749967 RepID=UPI0018CEE882|nr:1-propanol dehydrogenase PduQ [Facklamia lactis]MBG9979473.1 iron-containing alcohol dehydrogenase [Facklamia lactis]
MTVLNFVPQIVVGDDALDYLTTIEGDEIFIVTDKFISESSMLDALLEKLQNKNVTIFSDVVPDPPIDNITQGIKVLEENNANVVIAIGGGSALDAAKGIIYFAAKTGLSRKRNDIKFIAIPTTSGTGSEVTDFSVITDSDKGIKYPMVTRDILPDVALLYTGFVMNLPKKQTADTGIDVLTHAIEAYVSNQANSISDAFAEKAIKLVFEYLPMAYLQGSDNREAREQMHLASTMAGLAFNMVSLGINHSIAHAIGGKFHLVHGRINGIMLNSVIQYNAGLLCGNEKDNKNTLKCYAEIAHFVGVNIKEPKYAVLQLNKKINELLKTLEMPVNFKEAGLESSVILENLSEIAEAAMHDRCTPTNPRIPSQNDIEEIIKTVI